MTARLATSVAASALLRLCEQDGGFGTVIAKGDPTAGSIIVLLTERGAPPRIYERVLGSDGRYNWAESAGASNAEELAKFLERRRRFDPDLWILELDVVSAERFAAEMVASD